MNQSSTQAGAERALAAIVLTDAVSFSARMSVDEEGTLRVIQRDLRIIGDLCSRYGGKVLKSTGDGLLMSFYSAVRAVLCSQEIQKEFAQLAEGLPPEEHLKHRIGIHLGDVLFSHADVLGNGVNIAARLQTKSAPGGICISQTVYDVIKARVDINATCLGPIKLKNIQEPVTAFQIPPFGQSATMVVMQQPLKQPSPTGNLTPLERAVQALEQQPQIRRIKKLIFGTYQGVWENDPRVLAQFELWPLLEKLHQRHHTLISLEKALYLTASRLNHKEAYLTIADIILTALEPVYYQGDDATTTVGKTAVITERDQYRLIAQSLVQQTDKLRIKKLLYAIVHTAWENDTAALALHAMEDLVADIHQIAPTEADLSYHLERIIKRLNRQTRYTQLALIISEAFHPLYGTPTVPPNQALEQTSMDPSDGSQTVMATNEIPVSDDESSTSVVLAEDEVRVETDQTISKAGQLRTKESKTVEAASPPKARDRASLFTLRLEIMRYANPLRAKILLLSTVRSPFTSTQQDWLILKSKTLDDLIEDTFEYCSTFADLESKITIMCHCVENVTENVQTAGAILQAMRPFYP